MGIHESFDFARKLAVMVRVQGPDPKGLKMRNHAFHQYESGKTTISASGMILPHNLCDSEAAKRILGVDVGQGFELVLTVASVIEPFLTQQYRENVSQGRPELIPSAQISIMVEGKGEMDTDGVACCWREAEVLKMVDVPESSLALQSLFEASSGSGEHGWEVGWSLASSGRSTQTEHDGKPFIMGRQNQVTEELSNPNLIGRSITRIAVLGVNLFHEVPNIGTSPMNDRGEFLLAAGSPFGILSPMHFSNSLSVGSVANTFPPKSSSALLMADIRCLPGMEGGPVFCKHALVGILTRPLRQKNTGAEIQLVIPWEAIATASSDFLLREPKNAKFVNAIDDRNELPVQKAMSSVCLITIDNGVWASGVVLNSQGLILTNAHLLEPWRFGKTTIKSQRSGNENESLLFQPKVSTSSAGDGSMTNESIGSKMSSYFPCKRNIRVRLDHLNPWIWCDAKVVYICKGSLDFALLQLENVPDQLSPIVVDFDEPMLGSKAHVIGHGLLGPRCASLPSVCSGVVAKVVKTKLPSYYKSRPGEDELFPAMLETTAAIHPGGSGGAVVNAAGHMIGLVTSNARHSGGTVIPHLNFSIPSAILAPVFEFAREMQDFSLLHNIDCADEGLSAVWSLMPALSPKPGPPDLPLLRLEDDDKKEGKGSRFAKFIAERSEIMRKPMEPGEEGRPPNVNFRSKL